MKPSEENQLHQLMEHFFNDQMKTCILSKPVQKDGSSKIKIRPFLIHNEISFQAEEYVGKQVFHKNMKFLEMEKFLIKQLTCVFRQMDLISVIGECHVLVGKKGNVTIKVKKIAKEEKNIRPIELAHNRKKQYILEEGTPVDFLIDLGVMTKQGNIVHSKYDKFKQINRFLEFIEDVLPRLSQTKENLIIDFGCGKSYLTFAMYYYLKELKRYPVRIIGLDLKKDVIAACNELRTRYGFNQLDFYHGDISSYQGVDQVDMVVTLHACDTATDFALAKAVSWGAKVILSVPCCQHEINQQIANELMQPIFQYGLIKERMAALYTDALRAELLEGQGYRTQILEFISMDHTPKNILIRAVKQGSKKDNQKDLEAIMKCYHLSPKLAELLAENNEV